MDYGAPLLTPYAPLHREWGVGAPFTTRLPEVLNPSRPSSSPLPTVALHQLSLNTMYDMLAFATFRVYWTILHHKLTILVDGGSMHNFLQICVAKFLGLSSTPMDPLPVMVGNGGVMQCQHRYPQIMISIQGHHFTTDMCWLTIEWHQYSSQSPMA